MKQGKTDPIEQLAAAVRGLQEAVIRLGAHRDVDQSVLAALLMTCPDPHATRTSWQELASTWTTERALLAAAAQGQAVDTQGLASRATQERTAFWNQVFLNQTRDASD